WSGNYSQYCWLATMRGGRYAASWFLAPGQPLPGPETRTFKIIAGAHCSKKEKPPTIAGEPGFEQFGDRLVMTIWLHYHYTGPIRPGDGSLPDCPPLTIELPEPLGTRKLFNGGEYPPAPATVWEEPTAIPL